jgi:FlaA1/EpsC-like NDP-sugar epimerase
LETLGHKSGPLAGAKASLDLHDGAWREFLRRPAIETDSLDWNSVHSGRTILVAGAGGSIGSHLARRLAAADPRLLILLDNSEHNLYKIHRAVAAASEPEQTVAVLADMGDEAAMEDLFARHRPDLVYHTAAFKHVPLVESNSLAGLRNNVLGTWVLAQAAVRHGAEGVVALSTDKAANPRSVLGVSKRLAELVLAGLSNERTRMNSLRLGNVLGSRGSVAPLFLRQIARGGPVTVTDPEARRYFLTIEESVRLIVAVAARTEGGKLFAPEMGEPVRVAELAEFLIRRAGFTPGKEIAILFTGLRPGDKISEELISVRESKAESSGSWLYRVETPALEADELAECIGALRRAVERWDAAAALAVARRMAPEYRPSAELQQILGASGTEVRA